MRERGAPFIGPMVRAIIDGRKTQTRRLMNPQPGRAPSNENFLTWRGDYFFPGEAYDCARGPYGGPGDRIWIRETWRAFDLDGGRWRVEWQADGGSKEVDAEALRRAGREELFIRAARQYPRYRPPMFMPREASRGVLEVTQVRAQRLQEISELDCRAEGFQVETRPARINGEPGTVTAFDPRFWFAQGWDGLHGLDSWSSNPYVWVYTFRRVA